MAKKQTPPEKNTAKTPDAGRLALNGLCELASGRINDAVRLVTSGDELSPSVLSRLKLTCVSEINRQKDGGISLKFYDRLKALELLLGYAEKSGEAPAEELMAALKNSAQAVLPLECENSAN